MSKSGSKKKKKRTKKRKKAGTPTEPSSARQHKLAYMGVWAIAIIVLFIVLAVVKSTGS